MIKYAVRRHFDGVDDDLVTNYFDKLVQLLIRVPPLGTQEVRAYMMLLFVDQSDLDPQVKEAICAKVCEQLSRTWQGKRVDRAFLQTLHGTFSPERVEAASKSACNKPLAQMLREMVEALGDGKMERSDIAVALYRVFG